MGGAGESRQGAIETGRTERHVHGQAAVVNKDRSHAPTSELVLLMPNFVRERVGAPRRQLQTTTTSTPTGQSSGRTSAIPRRRPTLFSSHCTRSRRVFQ